MTVHKSFTQRNWGGLGIRRRLRSGNQKIMAAAERARLALKYRRAHKKFGITAPIIIYQMGKVGSSSFYHSLRALDLDVPVYHAHVLAKLDEYETAVRAQFPNPTSYLASLNKGRAVRREMDSARWTRWDLICLVRAPIPRSISQFFETAHTFIPDIWERAAQGALRLDELQEAYLSQFHDTSPLNWFEDQVRDPFGIDVYATPFDVTRGYEIYTRLPVRLLILRLEDTNRVTVPAFRKFLGLEHFTLQRFNETQSKMYNQFYQAFQNNLKLDQAFIAKMHSTRYARHFYTLQELAESAKRWTT